MTSSFQEAKSLVSFGLLEYNLSDCSVKFRDPFMCIPRSFSLSQYQLSNVLGSSETEKMEEYSLRASLLFTPLEPFILKDEISCYFSKPRVYCTIISFFRLHFGDKMCLINRRHGKFPYLNTGYNSEREEFGNLYFESE